jgi:hypothetical protein
MSFLLFFSAFEPSINSQFAAQKSGAIDVIGFI